jgi:hypothetical protein
MPLAPIDGPRVSLGSPHAFATPLTRTVDGYPISESPLDRGGHVIAQFLRSAGAGIRETGMNRRVKTMFPGQSYSARTLTVSAEIASDTIFSKELDEWLHILSPLNQRRWHKPNVCTF